MLTRRILFGSFLTIGLALAALAQNAPAPGAPGAPGTETKGLPPRATAGDYQGHANVGGISIGAEFLGHSFSGGERTFSSDDCVAVEIGVFAGADKQAVLSTGDFSLRITNNNGRKIVVAGVPFGVVFRSLKDPDWELEAAAKLKEMKKDSGADKSAANGQSDGSAPVAPKMPFPMLRAMQLQVRKSALPEGERALPQAGLVFFEYRGKESSIRVVELLYKGPAGEATLTLQ